MKNDEKLDESLHGFEAKVNHCTILLQLGVTTCMQCNNIYPAYRSCGCPWWGRQGHYTVNDMGPVHASNVMADCKEELRVMEDQAADHSQSVPILSNSFQAGSQDSETT